MSFQPCALNAVANWVIVLKCLLRLAASACILLLQAPRVSLCGSMIVQLLMLTSRAERTLNSQWQVRGSIPGSIDTA